MGRNKSSGRRSEDSTGGRADTSVSCDLDTSTFSHLHFIAGGSRALSLIALVFGAILTISPSPCLLMPLPEQLLPPQGRPPAAEESTDSLFLFASHPLGTKCLSLTPRRLVLLLGDVAQRSSHLLLRRL
eukprot:764016-Hanusia_phi.AAC.3